MPSTRAKFLLSVLSIALLRAAGSEAQTAASPPPVINVCEVRPPVSASLAPICAAWVWDGQKYNVTWGSNEFSQITIQQLGNGQAVFLRKDVTGNFTGLTGTYKGTLTSTGIANGTWTKTISISGGAPSTDSGTWSGTFATLPQASAVVQASAGFTTMVLGNTGYGNIGDGGPATAALIGAATGLAFDPQGDLFVADQAAHRVRKIASSSGIITAFAGTGTVGDSGDGGPAVKASLNTPVALAFSGGYLYIVDQIACRVRRVGKDGTISTFAGTGVCSAGGNDGDGASAKTAKLDFPLSIAAAPNGDIYIVGMLLNRIRKVDAKTNVITTVAGVAGVGAMAGDGGPANAAKLNGPSGMAFDSAGNLYIADVKNSRIRRVGAVTGIITTAASASGCTSIAFDKKDTMYVRCGSTIETLDLKTGKPTPLKSTEILQSNGQVVTAPDSARGFVTNWLSSPGGFTLDPAGNVFVGGKFCVLKIVTSGAAPSTP